MIDLSRQRDSREETTAEPSARQLGCLSEFVEYRNVRTEKQAAAFACELHAMLVQAVFSAENEFSVDSRLRFPKLPKGNSEPEIRGLMQSLLFWLITMTPEDGKTLINIRFIWS